MLLTLVTGCAHGPRPSAAGRGAGMEALSIRTDSATYTAQRFSHRRPTVLREYVTFGIVVTYTNRSDGPRYLASCAGVFAPLPILQKYERGVWRDAYGLPTRLCLDPVNVIQPGESRTFTYPVNGYIPIAPPRPHGYVGIEPEFLTTIPGTYRLLWGNIYDVWTGDQPYRGLGTLVPFEERLSNEFQVVEK